MDLMQTAEQRGAVSLDHELFLSHTEDRSLIEVLLKGHLWVESCLNRGVRIGLVKPDSVDLDRMPFSRKLDLAHGLGVVRDDLIQPLRLLNKLRNRLAHELTAEPTQDELLQLVSSLDTSIREPVLRAPADSGTGRLGHWLFAVLMILEASNMRREWELENQGALQAFQLSMQLQAQWGKEYETREELQERLGFPDPPDPRDAWHSWVSDAERLRRREDGPVDRAPET